jgi:lipopolysaccharide export system ATP-binding protein
MLAAKGLHKHFGQRAVVKGVDLSVERGEILGLLGPNGAGKTTIFYMVVGLIRPDAGDVWLDEDSITHLPVHIRARRGIGYLAQDPSIFRGLTVEQNIVAVLEAGAAPRERWAEITAALLDEFELTRVRRQAGATLSGGERRRVEIARVLAMQPSFILLDEPFTGVDPKSVAEIQVVVKRLRDRGLGVVITDHNVRDTLAITDRAEIIHDGHILFAGTAEEIMASEDARRFYLGESFRL